MHLLHIISINSSKIHLLNIVFFNNYSEIHFQNINSSEIHLFNIFFSCASAKAERSLSSLYDVFLYVAKAEHSLSSLYRVFLYVELGDPPPPRFHGSRPKHYITFVWLQICPWVQNCMGANCNITPQLKKNFFITDLTWPKRPPPTQWKCYGCKL